MSDFSLHINVVYLRILLNSLWGKFGQRNNLMQHDVISNPSDYYELLIDKKIRVSRVIPIDHEQMRISYEAKRSFISEHNAANIVVALWTTRFHF